MMTASRFGTSPSSGRNVRPSSGLTPSTVKKFALTRLPILSVGTSSRVPASPPLKLLNASTPSKLLVRSRIAVYSGYDARSTCARAPSIAVVEPSVITSDGRGTVSGRSSSASAQLKAAQLAQMPIASEASATSVKVGLWWNERTA
jgi:hypothetical protein